MKKLIIIPATAVFAFLSLQCKSDSDSDAEANVGTSPGAEMSDVSMVESGTYTGTANKVDPEEKEVYLKLDDGKMIELYLKDSTEVMQGGEAVAFDALAEGQKLEVEVEKSGESLNPVSVKIME
jgi:hypothetical protein